MNRERKNDSGRYLFKISTGFLAREIFSSRAMYHPCTQARSSSAVICGPGPTRYRLAGRDTCPPSLDISLLVLQRFIREGGSHHSPWLALGTFMKTSNSFGVEVLSLG
ncbi:hypothetical protein EVAR_91452_1 [Eumeta japonica]|uniref:Uncharacterized protein n=1 Tax=Eumeta variegata TaxID=151549 RepID=A0A4C1X150_EUMVA|nr:hypothetical protein EVAR_91452_1 [Eumeta japonica]